MFTSPATATGKTSQPRRYLGYLLPRANSGGSSVTLYTGEARPLRVPSWKSDHDLPIVGVDLDVFAIRSGDPTTPGTAQASPILITIVAVPLSQLPRPLHPDSGRRSQNCHAAH